jgi:hypothetical protein
MGWRLFNSMEVILLNRLGSCSSCASTGSEYCCWLSFYLFIAFSYQSLYYWFNHVKINIFLECTLAMKLEIRTRLLQQ